MSLNEREQKRRRKDTHEMERNLLSPTRDHTDAAINTKDVQRDPEDDKEFEICLDKAEYHEVVKSDAFVDKSLHIKKFFESKDQMITALLVAPSRFGKSTNMNMTKNFLEIMVDAKGEQLRSVIKDANGKWEETEDRTENFKLFKNLKIYQCQCAPKHNDDDCKEGRCTSRNFFYEHCGQHPIIYVSLKDVTCNCEEDLWDSLRIVLHDTYLKHSYLMEAVTSRLSSSDRKTVDLYCDRTDFTKLSKTLITEGLRSLARFLFNQFKKEVFIMVDEFDSPISRLIHESEKCDLDHMQFVMDTIGMILSTVLKDNEHVSGGYLVACVQVGHALSAYANTVESYPFLEDHLFSDYCGFTKAEIKELLKRPIFRGFDEDDIEKRYNGYKVLKTKQQMFCTYSVLYYLWDWEKGRRNTKNSNLPTPPKKGHKPRFNWIEAQGVTNLEAMFAIGNVRQLIGQLQEKEMIAIDIVNEKMTPQQILSLRSLVKYSHMASPDITEVHLFLEYLKDRGYFNMVEKAGSRVTLEIPNIEIASELVKGFYNADFYQVNYKFTNDNIDAYADAVRYLEGSKTETFQKLVDSVAKLFSDPVERPRNHDELKGPLFTFIFNERAYETRSELFCMPGRKFRLDQFLLRNDGTGIIFEIKYGSEDAEVALKQIFDNKYYEAFNQYEIKKEKMHVGLTYNSDGKVTICAFVTNHDEHVKHWNEVHKNRLIRKCSN